MLRSLETYEGLLNESIKKYLLQLQMGNVFMADFIYHAEVLPTFMLYKKALWAEKVNNSEGIIYSRDNSGKIVLILIEMARAITLF